MKRNYLQPRVETTSLSLITGVMSVVPPVDPNAPSGGGGGEGNGAPARKLYV